MRPIFCWPHQSCQPDFFISVNLIIKKEADMNNVLDLQNLIQGFKLSCQTEGKALKLLNGTPVFLKDSSNLSK